MSIDFVPFSICGASVGTSGQFIGTDLYIPVPDSGNDEQTLNLYTVSEASGGLLVATLYLENFASSGNIPLYIKGLSLYDGNPYAIDNFYPASGDINLFIHRQLTDYVSMFIQQSDGSGITNLYTGGSIIQSGIGYIYSEYLNTIYSWRQAATFQLDPSEMGFVGDPALVLDDFDYNGTNQESLLQSSSLVQQTIEISGINTSTIVSAMIRSIGGTYDDSLLGLNLNIPFPWNETTFSDTQLVNIRIYRYNQFGAHLYIYGSGHDEKQLELYTHGF